MDPAAFGPIFDAHHTAVWRFLHRLGGRECADELAGEVFATALANRHRFDPTRGAVESWLYGIAANLARDWRRRRARGFRALERLASRNGAAAAAEAAGNAERIDARVSGSSDAQRVLGAMRRLPDADREVIVLFAWEERSYEEIAAVLGVPVGTVRSRLSRARARLRELAGLGDQVPTER